jgi:PAS domain S-box-containing protein
MRGAGDSFEPKLSDMPGQSGAPVGTSDDSYRRLVESVQDYAIVMLTPAGIVGSWNAGARRIMGYEAQEAVGRHLSLFYTPEAIAEGGPDEELRRALDVGRLEEEGLRIRKDGSAFHAHSVIAPVLDMNGAHTGFSMVIRDRTERRAHEQQLAESERNLRLLVESVQDYALFTLDVNGNITSWNRGAERIKGYTADEAIGMHFSMFYRPEENARAWPQEELARAVSLGKYEDEGWRIRKDGSLIWANVIITALRDAHGKLMGFSKITRDLTERRRHEDELRQREEDFRLLVEGVRGHAMFLVDTEGCIRTWNAGAQRMLGYDAEQVLGKPTSILYTEEDQAAGQFQAALAAARAKGHIKFQAWRQRADGVRIRVEVSTTAVRDPQGDSRGFVQIIQDLTDRQRMEALESEGRRITEFIAMLSHELRNPLAPIRNAVAILKRFVDNPETAWCAELIGRQVTHMTRLVDDLLDVSRVATGKIRLDVHPVALGELVAEAVEAMRPAVHGHGLSLVLSIEAARMTICGDATRLTQVIVNLVNNAAKYTPAPGEVAVSLKSEGAQAVLEVADTGIGLQHDLMDRVFDPFVQGEQALARSEGGLGIGLTLVRSVVELHRGSVSVQSEGPGKGTKFRVNFPLTSPDSVEPPPIEPPRPVVRSKVLVVDDNEDAAETLAMLLRLNGHEVEVAYDGDKALEIAATYAPDVAFLDIGLPGMDGYEVARRLHEMPGLGRLRLVAVTGYGQEKDKEAATAAGFHLHVTKPVEPAELAKLVAA